MTGFARVTSAAAVVFLGLMAAQPARAQESSDSLPMLGSWSGQFRSVQMTQDSRNAGGYVGRITGTVNLQPRRESGILFYDVVIQISTNSPGDQLEWGVSLGRCGSKLIMVENANQLPSFDTRSGGEGEIRHSVPLDLDAKHTYQVGLFRNGHAQQNMIACANLKYDSRMH